MVRYQISDRMGTGYHRLPREDDEFDYGESFETHDLEGIRLTRGDRKWFDHENDLDVKFGQVVWLVYCEYTTGSTFGRTEGNIQYIEIFDNEQEAIDCVKVINEDGPGEVEIVFNGEKVSRYVNGDGYFDSLTGVYMGQFVLE